MEKFRELIQRWLPFVVFFTTCAILGSMKLLSKNLKLALVIMVSVSIVIAFLIDLLKKNEDDGKE